MLWLYARQSLRREDGQKAETGNGTVTEMPEHVLQLTITKLLSLVDGAVEVVALHGYNSDSPSVKKWAQEWVKTAAEYGCTIEP